MNMSTRSNFKILMVIGLPATISFAALAVIRADFVFAVFAALMATLELIGALALTTTPGQGASVPPMQKSEEQIALDSALDKVWAGYYLGDAANLV